MRVCIKRTDGRTTVIEIVQMIRYGDTDIVGLIMQHSEYLTKRKYDHYQSTTPAFERDFNYWCEQLMRNGYLDLTRSELEFKSANS